MIAVRRTSRLCRSLRRVAEERLRLRVAEQGEPFERRGRRSVAVCVSSRIAMLRARSGSSSSFHSPDDAACADERRSAS